MLIRFFLWLTDGVLQLVGFVLFLFLIAKGEELNERGTTMLLWVGGVWLVLMLIVRGARAAQGGK